MTEDICFETRFEAASPQRAPGAEPKIDALRDVPMTVTVELGRTRLLVRDLLELQPGSVLELAKLAGEPLDVLVNGKPLARGEAVRVADGLGVRITELVQAEDREGQF